MDAEEKSANIKEERRLIAGSLYLHTPVSFKPPMGWPQLVIHMFCVGLPFTLVVRRYANGKS